MSEFEGDENRSLLRAAEGTPRRRRKLWALAECGPPFPISLWLAQGLFWVYCPSPLSPMTLGLRERGACSPYLWHLNLPDDEVNLLRTGACLGVLETVSLPGATAAVH